MDLLQSATDRLFLRFCRTGDAGALGQVFDRTAPELLRVGIYLSGNRADAEDLVQRTFLAAIESRASYDRSRRAVPWLLGILANHMRRLRRERAARPHEVEARSAPDPVRAAADRELVEAVAKLRAEIGEPYHSVLQLHLEQGLNAKEIAARLSRPAGTVRTQLMRALEMLRQRLPSGFVAGLLPVMPESVSLAAVRETVVAAARHAAGAAVAGSAGSALTFLTGMTMTKKLVTGGSFLALCLATYGTWSLWAAPPSPLPAVAPEAAAPRPEGGGRPGSGVAAAVSGAPRRETVATQAEKADPGFALLRVVLRWEHDGRLAQGVGVSACDPTLYELRREGITGAEGTCTLRHLHPGTWRVRTSHSNEDLAVELAADEQRTLDLTVVQRAVLRGVVVDADGRPVADARIWLSERGETAQHEVASSDALGRFVVPLFGKHLIGARKRGHALSLARHVDAGTSSVEDIVLTLRGTGATVRGTVRDVQGRPVPWARVQAGNEFPLGENRGPWARAETDAMGEQVLTGADGTFEVAGIKPGPGCVCAWAHGFGPAICSVDVPAGEVREIQVRLTTAAVIAGTVRDSAGKPVAGVFIIPERRAPTEPEPANAAKFFDYRRPNARSDALGRFRLGHLPAGVVWMAARKDKLEARATFELFAGAEQEWNPTLGLGRSIQGVVLGADGAPMPGIKVAFIPPNLAHPRGHETTDAAGRFVLRSVGDAPVAVEVGGDLRQEPLQMLSDVAPDTTDLVFRIRPEDRPTAWIRGRLVDHMGGPVAATIEIRDDGPHMQRIRGVTTDATGAFALGPMRPIQRRLGIRTQHLGSVPLDPVDLVPDQTRDLGTIVVREPGRATFRVFDSEGKPVVRGNVSVGTRDGKKSVGWTDIDNGKATIEALPPGTWWVTTNVSTGPSDIEIQSGKTTHLELHHRR